MSTTLSPHERDQILSGLPVYTNGVQSPFPIAPADSFSQPTRHVPQYNVYGALPFSNKFGEQNHGSYSGYENIDPLFGHPPNPYDNQYVTVQNNSQFFPTPPLSTNVPNFFDNPGFTPIAPNHRSMQTPRRLQFGSDVRFEGQTFVAPPDQETPETLVKRRMNHLECLKPEPSPASTHPSSPILQKKNRNPTTYTTSHQEPSIIVGHKNDNDHDQMKSETPEPKPRKRRKTDPDSDPDFEAPQKPSRQLSKRTKSSSAKKAPAPLGKSSRENSASQSRPSSVKSSRQHLTEEQKKSNHIISEQKRRDLIKQGYEGIREMVPALKDVKYSKGVMLEFAADWLEDIVKSNKDLRHQLASIKGC